MAAYLFERVARSLLVLLGVVLVAYVLVLATGDPAGAMSGPDVPPDEVARIRAELG
jgi:ABC-type dipeptide/oligopeptide/nickel transport system permease component